MRILYFMDVAGVSPTQAMRTYWGQLAERRDGEEFANEIVRLYGEHADAVDDLIRSTSHHWRLERMPVVDRNVIRVATVELREIRDVPKRVTLNEAVEMAKRFGSESSASFVNGVLDRIATELGKS